VCTAATPQFAITLTVSSAALDASTARATTLTTFAFAATTIASTFATTLTTTTLVATSIASAFTASAAGATSLAAAILSAADSTSLATHAFSAASAATDTYITPHAATAVRTTAAAATSSPAHLPRELRPCSAHRRCHQHHFRADAYGSVRLRRTAMHRRIAHLPLCHDRICQHFELGLCPGANRDARWAHRYIQPARFCVVSSLDGNG
jgi:hypothetical protein